MTTIRDIGVSITKLLPQEALDLIMKIRLSRRTVKKVVKIKTKTKTKTKIQPRKTLLNSVKKMSEADRRELILMLKGN